MDAAQPLRVLVVCTANVCRSPFAAAVFAHRLGALPGGDRVRVTGAGVRAMTGAPVDPAMADHLEAEEAVLLDGAVARQLDERLVREADLVLALAREHRRAAVALVPARQRRVMTLLELARAGRAAADAGLAPVADAPDALRALVAASAAHRGPTAPDDPAADDVADPHRRPAPEYAAAAALVRRAVDDVVGALPLR
ncbi:hypothetical protein WDZ17_05240 [Pseudokineococcus basanitobsidens]|uniref:protein-tyrosine-phosphatase n=1 Tax=Pseudokineococcus basanitobsidens TaxID=1926649 RepID=A0ABU8RHZ7_9ACTN